MKPEDVPPNLEDLHFWLSVESNRGTLLIPATLREVATNGLRATYNWVPHLDDVQIQSVQVLMGSPSAATVVHSHEYDNLTFAPGAMAFWIFDFIPETKLRLFRDSLRFVDDFQRVETIEDSLIRHGCA